MMVFRIEGKWEPLHRNPGVRVERERKREREREEETHGIGPEARHVKSDAIKSIYYMEQADHPTK